jgi:hypothetical protein
MAKVKKQKTAVVAPEPSKGGRRPGLSPQAKLLEEHGYITAANASRLMKNEVLTIYRWIDAEIVKGACIGERKYVKVQSLIDHVGPEMADIFGLYEYLPKNGKPSVSSDEED